MKKCCKILKLCPRSHLPSSVLWNLWIHSLGVSSCLTSRPNRLTAIRMFSCILLLCSWSNFAQHETLRTEAARQGKT